ncbi:MAG: DUF4339 domain-containing protein [Clostridia bacterium]|nr:DUF4339 domain-containing protein [Deltaproteobacteria bacterium]
MSDIWSGVSSAIPQNDGEWLYRIGEEVRGPVPFESVVSKLLSGELTPKTMVAREGGEWHPIAQVAAFEPHVAIYQENVTKKSSQIAKRIAMVLGVIVLIAAGIAGTWLMGENDHKAVLAEVARLRSETELDRQRHAFETMPRMGLVALVTIDQEAIKIKKKTSSSSGSKRLKSGGKSGVPGSSDSSGDEDDMVMSCKLSQNDIFSTLKKHLAKINVCVEDEKTRDAVNLPGQLELEFVVKPTGTVTDFHVNDRHYRTGPMNNCMIKAFNTIKFSESDGTNCPVTIPIKIGS